MFRNQKKKRFFGIFFKFPEIDFFSEQTQLTFVPTLFCYVNKIKNKKMVNNCRRRCILKILQKNLKNSQNMKNFEKTIGATSL